MAAREIEIDFKNIQPHDGDKRKSFEDLCCHLFYSSLSDAQKRNYTRLNGDGGDGGVECIVRNNQTGIIGVQSKYVFEFDKLLPQITESYKTAIRNYPNLQEYYIYFPFNLTGNTTKKKGSLVKYEEWKKKMEGYALRNGSSVKIIKKTKSDIESDILVKDSTGSMRLYYFGQEIIDDSWFRKRVEESIFIANKRFNSKFQIPTETTDVLESFCQTPNYKKTTNEILGNLKKAVADFDYALNSSDCRNNDFPDCYNITKLLSDLESIKSGVLDAELNSTDSFDRVIGLINKVIDSASDIYDSSKNKYEEIHGAGSATSPGLKQFNAEYLCSFPTAHLDCLFEWKEKLAEFKKWLTSRVPQKAFEQSLFLTGLAGRGKTNAICNAAKKITEQGRSCCLLFGTQFLTTSSILEQIKTHLRIPADWSVDNMLDVLDLISDEQASPFVIFIDAINETSKLGDRFWSNSIPEMISIVKKHPMIKICFSCRSGFDYFCIPKELGIAEYECLGFKSIETKAIKVFFDSYNLTQPSFPLINEEFSNPLFLTLFCETLSNNADASLFSDWLGFDVIFGAYFEMLSERYNKYASSFGGKDLIEDTISFIGEYLINSKTRFIPRKKIVDGIKERNRDADKNYVNWLISENLFISNDGFSSLYLSFDLLNDYVIAKTLLSVYIANQEEFKKSSIFFSVDTIKAFRGSIKLFSNLFSELYVGKELIDIFEEKNEEIKQELRLILLESLKSRNPKAITERTKQLVLSFRKITYTELFNNILPLSVADCCLDVYFLTAYYINHGFRSLAEKDSIICPFLHLSYDEKGIVYHIISLGLSLTRQISDEMAFRYCLVLALFTAASDRRVKDYSTRALINLLLLNPLSIWKFLRELLRMNFDGVVFERSLLAVYGFLLLSNDSKALSDVSDVIANCYDGSSVEQVFRNGEIRELLVSILDLAEKQIPDRYYPNYRKPLTSDFSKFGIESEDINDYIEMGREIHFLPNDFYSDFYKYSLPGILRYWTNGIRLEKQEKLKETAGKWIVSQIIDDYGYINSNCKRFDDYIIGTYGGGRGRERWAERIGKKYQWLASHEFVSDWYDKCYRKKRQSIECFLNCRELDPTVLSFIPAKEEERGWWNQFSFDMKEPEPFQKWIDDVKSIPSMKTLLSKINHNGQEWLLLSTYHSQTEEHDYRSSSPYREIWFFLWGYIVRNQDLKSVISLIERANFEGRWMPEPTNYGSPHFVGEYNHEIQDDEPTNYTIRGTFISVVPTWKDYIYEWEYDATCESVTSSFLVPSVELLNQSIRWNGKGGWIDSTTGKVVLNDPSLEESGERILLVDSDYITSWLKEHDCTLVWTLLGERLIIRDNYRNEEKPLSFSKIAWLDSSGQINESDCNYFDLNGTRLDFVV